MSKFYHESSSCTVRSNFQCSQFKMLKFFSLWKNLSNHAAFIKSNNIKINRVERTNPFICFPSPYVIFEDANFICQDVVNLHNLTFRSSLLHFLFFFLFFIFPFSFLYFLLFLMLHKISNISFYTYRHIHIQYTMRSIHPPTSRPSYIRFCRAEVEKGKMKKTTKNTMSKKQGNNKKR